MKTRFYTDAYMGAWREGSMRGVTLGVSRLIFNVFSGASPMDWAQCNLIDIVRKQETGHCTAGTYGNRAPLQAP